MKSAIGKAFAVILFLIGLGLTALPASGQPLRYKLTNMGNMGGPRSTAVGINDNGVSVGNATTPSVVGVAFRHSGVAMQGLGLPTSRTSVAEDVNISGSVVGYYFDQNLRQRGFRIIGDEVEDVGSLVPNGATSVTAISNSGAIAGNSNVPDPDQPGQYISHAFLRVAGDTDLTDLGALADGEVSWAYAVTDGPNGELYVVGSAEYSPNGSMHAFLHTSEDGMQDLGTLPLPGSFASRATAINSLGVAVGDSTGSWYSYACMWPADGQPVSLGALEIGGSSSAWAINTQGAVVGWSSFLDSAGHAFIYTPTEGMVDLNNCVVNMDPNWVLETAYDINNSGQIVGTARHKTEIGRTFAFRLDPVKLTTMRDPVPAPSAAKLEE